MKRRIVRKGILTCFCRIVSGEKLDLSEKGFISKVGHSKSVENPAVPCGGEIDFLQWA